MFAPPTYRLLVALGFALLVCRASLGADIPPKPDPTTASGAVEAMLNAANKGNYDEARKLQTDRWADEQKFWQKEAGGEGYVGSWKNLTRGGTIAKVDIQGEVTKGEVTFVRTLVTYAQSPDNKPLTSFTKFKVIKNSGVWQCDGF